MTSQVALVVKKLLTSQEMQDTWVQSLGWEDPLQEEMTTHSSILTWEIPWTEELGSYSHKRVGHDWAHKTLQGLNYNYVSLHPLMLTLPTEDSKSTDIPCYVIYAESLLAKHLCICVMSWPTCFLPHLPAKNIIILVVNQTHPFFPNLFLLLLMTSPVLVIQGLKLNLSWDFPGSPVAKTSLLVQEAWVQSLVEELDPTCCN